MASVPHEKIILHFYVIDILVHHCLTNPCQNGMACAVNSLNERKCNCRLGFLGNYCEGKETQTKNLKTHILDKV